MEEKQRCPSCEIQLKEPFIQCAECDDEICICLHCFVQGWENTKHKNNHDYTIVRNDFPLFTSEWTAGEELHLLEALIDCGCGNWQDVSYQVYTKSPSECFKHYQKYYIESNRDDMPKFPDPVLNPPPPPIVYKLSDDPPRPTENSSFQNDMSGYMAARGDFSHEYNNYAEIDIQYLAFSDEDSDLETELKFAVLNAYHNVLRERQRRKRIIRDHGLINLSKLQIINVRYSETIKNLLDKLYPIVKCFSPMEADMYLETLHYEKELRNDIRQLQDMRKAGVTKLGVAHVYQKLKARRESEIYRPKILDEVIVNIEDETCCQMWLQRLSSDAFNKGLPPSIAPAARIKSVPLDIVALPGYEKLSEREKELCSSVRLVPDSFMEFKNILVNECRNQGFLRLAQARTLIKIDVNKTRKIFDFLCTEGSINKEPKG